VEGNKSCLAYQTFTGEVEGEEAVMGTGLIFWDAVAGAIRETCFDQPSGLFQNGTWKPDGKRLVGEFVDYDGGGGRSRAKYVIEFVDADTMKMTGSQVFVFKRK
jgi:hypothetical protein